VLFCLAAAVLCDPPRGDTTTTPTNIVGGRTGGVIPVAVSSGSTTVTGGNTITTVTSTTSACGQGDLGDLKFVGTYEVDYSCDCCGGYVEDAWLDFYWQSITNGDNIVIQADVDIDFDYDGRVINDFDSTVRLTVEYEDSYYFNEDGEYYEIDTIKSDLCVEGLHFQKSSGHDFAFAINGEWVNIGTLKDIQDNGNEYCQIYSLSCCNKRDVLGGDRPTLDEKKVDETETKTTTTTVAFNSTELLRSAKTMTKHELTQTITRLHGEVEHMQRELRREESAIRALKKQRKASLKREHKW